MSAASARSEKCGRIGDSRHRLVDVIASEPDFKNLVRPYSIATDSHGRIIVTDPGAGGVHIFDFAQQKYKFIEQPIFAQGDGADAVFYIQKGKVGLTVVSQAGKEATIGILGEGNFFGEGALAGQTVRMGSATALTDCELLRVDKKAMMTALHREHAFSDMFVAYLLSRNIRYEEDLVDQLFNSSEKRLARVLLLLAHFGKEGIPETVVPKISQETLAEMIGTTRSRVSFFMNR